jgi:hypothetical protein
MRRVGLDATGTLTLGKPFWARPLTDFPWVPRPSYMTSYESMDPQSQADATRFVSKLLLQVVPKASAPRVWSERSITFQQATPTTAQLALLVRDDGTPSSLRMWASLCDLATSPDELLQLEKAFAHGELVLAENQCNWSAPVETNIPDSRSKTCAGTLPATPAGAGGLRKYRYLVGNQLAKIWDRDPLTLSLSTDGVSFDCVLAVRARCEDGQRCGGPGHEFFPGFGKGPGYQYPAAAVVGDALWITYSIAKEQIGVTRVPLSELVCRTDEAQQKMDEVIGGGSISGRHGGNDVSRFKSDDDVVRCMLCHTLALGGDPDECDNRRCAPPHAAAPSSAPSRALDSVRVAAGDPAEAEARDYHAGGLALNAFTRDPALLWMLSPTPADTTNISWHGGNRRGRRCHSALPIGHLTRFILAGALH